MLDPYKQQPNLFLPHPNHYDNPDHHRHRQRIHRQHRSAAAAGRRAVGPLMPPPPPQRMPFPNCCSSSAATSSVVSETISLDLTTEQYFGGPVDVRDNLDIPPLPRPLKLSKEWRPLQTSTLMIYMAHFRRPTRTIIGHKIAPNCAVGAAPEFVRPAVHGHVFWHDFGRVQINPFGAIQFGLIDGQSKRHSRHFVPQNVRQWRLGTESADPKRRLFPEEPELLGGMSFLLVKMIKIAQLRTTQNQQCFFHYADHQSHLPMSDKCITNSPYAAGGSSISDFVAQLPTAPPLLVHVAVPFLLIAATFVGLFNSTVALGLHFQFRVVALGAMHCAHCPVDISLFCEHLANAFIRSVIQFHPCRAHVLIGDVPGMSTLHALHDLKQKGKRVREQLRRVAMNGRLSVPSVPASGARPPSSPAPLADFTRAHALHDLNQNGKRVRERLRRVAQNGGLSSRPCELRAMRISLQ
ncbi:hypothetical protein niasHS_009531 [Heterodera schachtii]|uniref:Uncharacterized protein n=1 Tax=Heterodera schachtii TaxID=97005 RepID=A0ABD2JC85_HETSC